MQHFNNGVNLGGWLSQYSKFDHEHFHTFITRRDIEQIASWGMNHVRLPVDYPVLESDEAPGVFLDEGLQYIDSCLEWCKSCGLGVILDLHHAPGYTFTNTLSPDKQHLNTLFTQESAQQRFIGLWQTLARRYQSSELPLVLELLNEVVLPDSAPWNGLIRRTVDAIRVIDPTRVIMVGGNNYNSASDLKYLDVLDDPNVWYTFHDYEPFLFTHQKAPWTKVVAEYNQSLEYPGPFIGLDIFLKSAPQWADAYQSLVGKTMNQAMLLTYLQPAIDFIKKTGRTLYCGEFGVISGATARSRQNWHADFIDLLRQQGIGRAVWSYKEMDFGLVDKDGHVVDHRMVELVSRP